MSFVFIACTFSYSAVTAQKTNIKTLKNQFNQNFSKGLEKTDSLFSKIKIIHFPKKAKKAISAKPETVATKNNSIATGKIKINLPKVDFRTLTNSKLFFWNNKINIDGISISENKLSGLKKVKINTIADNIENLDFKLSKLDEKRNSILEQKQELLNDLETLKIQDSLKRILKPEIIDAANKEHALFTIPVGFTDMDEQIRNLTLLGQLPIENTLSQRPYYTNNKLSYKKIISLIDTNLNYEGELINRKNFSISLLPFNFSQKYNSQRPYGGNDGAMSYSKGYQFQTSTGVFLHWGNLNVQLKPEYVNASNESYTTSPYWGQGSNGYRKFLPGQSSIRYDLGKITVSAGTENLWWGPGIYNSILMSNNATGFFHYSLQTNRPIKNFLGTFQFHLIGGTLTKDSSQVFENYGLKKRNIRIGDRYLSSLAFDYTPSFLKNITFGVNRSIQTYTASKVSGLVNDKLPVIGAFFGATAAVSDTFPRDQLVAISVRWFFPKDHAELYYQFAYNDAKENFRDLWLDMSHSTAYILGFKKLFTLTDQKYLDLGVEALKLAQTPSYLHRNAGNFYEHSTILEGYTNQNQILGSGAGFGNNIQTFSFSYNNHWNKVGLIFNHIANNPMALVSGVEDLGLRTIKWDDYSYGIQSRYRYKNILFSANMEWVNSRNYQWVDGNSAGNFYAFLNTIFLW
ncbi:MAG: hypothetical protein NT104_05655 [Bacteroidetes bacterium]|nr:hypothetical protein [Bacteroidota bacterium]